jgi:hypothetical protein
MATMFDRALDPGFIEQLASEATKGGWWADVLCDPKLVVALRGKYLNVYWRGQSLFRVGEGPIAPRVTTHEKYLLDPELDGQISLIGRAFNIESLLQRALVRSYEGPSTLRKLKATAGLFSGTEKTGCHEIAVHNDNIIDVEIAFPGTVSLDDGGDDRQAPRVDFASIEASGDQARLVFWEAKAYGNGELRAMAGKTVPVCRQISFYRKYLSDHRNAVEKSYTRVAENIVAIKGMGWERSLSPLIEEIGNGKRQLTLGQEPKIGLIIFGFDAGQRDYRGWKEDHFPRLKATIPDVQAVGDPKGIRIRT